MQHQRGFNLVELMVVVALMGIIAGIGVPSFREFIATQRVKSAAFEFAAALMHARDEARKGTPVSIARTGDSWSSGWVMQVGGNTLATQQALDRVTITPVDDPDRASFEYKRTRPHTPSMRFEIAGENTPAKRCILIGSDGVLKTLPASCPES